MLNDLLSADPTLADYRRICAMEWQRITPFRLGMTIGRLTGRDFDNPYPINSSYAHKHFSDGLEFGKLKRATGR